MISICYVPLEKREGLRLRLEGLFLCSCFFLEQDSLLFELEEEKENEKLEDSLSELAKGIGKPEKLVI